MCVLPSERVKNLNIKVIDRITILISISSIDFINLCYSIWVNVTLHNTNRFSKNLHSKNMTRIEFTKSRTLTCDFSFSHPTPERFRLSHGPVLHLRAEAAEELVLFEVWHPSVTAVSCVVDHTGTRRGWWSTFLSRHLPINLVKLIRSSPFSLQFRSVFFADLFYMYLRKQESFRQVLQLRDTIFVRSIEFLGVWSVLRGTIVYRRT